MIRNCLPLGILNMRSTYPETAEVPFFPLPIAFNATCYSVLWSEIWRSIGNRIIRRGNGDRSVRGPSASRIRRNRSVKEYVGYFHFWIMGLGFPTVIMLDKHRFGRPKALSSKVGFGVDVSLNSPPKLILVRYPIKPSAPLIYYQQFAI